MCFVYSFLKFDMTCWSMGCKIDVVFGGRNFILMKLNSASKSSSKPGGFHLERKQPSRVGMSPLCDVVSSFLCHTLTDGKDKLLEWPDRSCLLLYVSARIH